MGRTLTIMLGTALSASLALNGFLGYQYARLNKDYKNLYQTTQRACDLVERVDKQNEHLKEQNERAISQNGILIEMNEDLMRKLEQKSHQPQK